MRLRTLVTTMVLSWGGLPLWGCQSAGSTNSDEEMGRANGGAVGNDAVGNDADCDDADENAAIEVTVYADADGDGLSVAQPEVLCLPSADAPEGYLLEMSAETDCDDADANRNPDLAEIPYNGLDDDCDASTLDDDLDQDGDGSASDCDDGDPARASTFTETYYNGIDDDCDASTLDDDQDGDGVPIDSDCDDDDASLSIIMMGYADLDEDSFSVAVQSEVCTDGTLPSTHFAEATEATDCQDDDPSIYPLAALETPYNGLDDDCDPRTLDDDLDHDGYRASEDCDDTNPHVHDGRFDFPDDGIDQDCSGTAATAADLALPLYVDINAEPGGDGSSSAPFQNIGDATAVASSGQAILIASGNYDEDLAHWDNPLFGSYDADDWTRSAGPPTTIITGSLRLIPTGSPSLSDPLVLDRIEVQSGASWAVTVEDAVDVLIHASVLSPGATTAGPARALSVTNPQANLTVLNSTIEGMNTLTSDSFYSSYTIYASCDGVELVGNTIESGTGHTSYVLRAIGVNTLSMHTNTMTQSGANTAYAVDINGGTVTSYQDVIDYGPCSASTCTSRGLSLREAEVDLWGTEVTGSTNVRSNQSVTFATGCDATAYGLNIDSGTSTEGSIVALAVGPGATVSIDRSEIRGGGIEGALGALAAISNVGGSLTLTNSVVVAGYAQNREARAYFGGTDSSLVAIHNTLIASDPNLIQSNNANAVVLSGSVDNLLVNNIIDSGPANFAERGVWVHSGSDVLSMHGNLFVNSDCPVAEFLVPGDVCYALEPASLGDESLSACDFDACASSSDNVVDAAPNLNATTLRPEAGSPAIDAAVGTLDFDPERRTMFSFDGQYRVLDPDIGARLSQ